MQAATIKLFLPTGAGRRFREGRRNLRRLLQRAGERQPLRVVFRDSGFKDDSVKINVEQIFKLMSPHTDVKTI